MDALFRKRLDRVDPRRLFKVMCGKPEDPGPWHLFMRDEAGGWVDKGPCNHDHSYVEEPCNKKS